MQGSLGDDTMTDMQAQLYVHLAWATYRRLPLVAGEVRTPVYAAIHAACGELDAEVVALGGVADHVHLLVRLPPTVAVGAVAHRARGAAAHLVNHTFPETFFLWQTGYVARTVSPSQVPVVTQYVRTQEMRHAAGTLVPSLEPLDGWRGEPHDVETEPEELAAAPA